MGVALAALLASSATLVCCVLPTLFVALGAGAALAGLVSDFPQLIWLSEHKALVFGTAGFLLVVAGAALWRARYASCPTDPLLARSCLRLRRTSQMVYSFAVAAFTIGVLFAFVFPQIL